MKYDFMKKLKLSPIFIIATIMLSAQVAAQNYTVIISLDGFRWDYPQIHNTPNLHKIADKGVQAVMSPSYPSSTFPNHYTLMTGLVPDHHGIVNNSFWDRAKNIQYSIGDSLTRNNPEYYKGKTIWATARQQGVKTASVYWVGSDIPINDNFPEYYKVWAEEPRLTFSQRVDTTLAWLSKPQADRPRLITLYMDEPDGSGHRSGPRGQETKATVHMLDSLVGKLMAGISVLPYADSINLIVTADHGMTDVSPERYYKVDDYLKPTWYDRIVGANPSSIFATGDNVDSIYNALSKLKHLKVYRKNKIPKSLKYGTNPNIGDLIVVPDLGWQFGFKPAPIIGAHGYDPKHKDMSVIFFAYGPDFKVKYKGKNFNNTAIYPLLCYLLNIKPASNDGNSKQFRQFIRKTSDNK